MLASRRWRAVALWTCGLAASAIFGGYVGYYLSGGGRYGEGGGGVLAGALAFACFRLWKTEH
jgi:hypothetical protein